MGAPIWSISLVEQWSVAMSKGMESALTDTQLLQTQSPSDSVWQRRRVLRHGGCSRGASHSQNIFFVAMVDFEGEFALIETRGSG
jgi:hypothetical protein